MLRKYNYKLLKDVAHSQITEENLNAQGELGWKLIFAQVRTSGNWDAIFIRE